MTFDLQNGVNVAVVTETAQSTSRPEVVCTICGWLGSNDDLNYPHYILDDDLADYGGDCPQCGENSLDGKMIDFE